MGESHVYAMVEQVKLENANDHDVSFTTRAASKTGDRDDCVRQTFTVPRADVWSTPIDGAPPPVAMTPGAVGNLFLSKEGWQTTSADGYKIFGVNSDVPIFKFPVGAGALRFFSELTVVPSSIVVRGALEGESRFIDIDLYSHDAADAQDVRWNGADYIVVQLTTQGAQRLRLARSTAAVRMWPSRIVVAGAPAVDPTCSGSVDLLDRELAGPVQHLTYVRRGSRLSLSLTQDGFAAFHVVPGLHEPHARPHHSSDRAP